MSWSKTEQGIIDAINADMDAVGVPRSQFSPEFVVRMIKAMQISHFKYGFLADAYPLTYQAHPDIRVRVGKYRETGNFWYLADAANFAMMETMYPDVNLHVEFGWQRNDAEDSPGRTSGRKLVLETNSGIPLREM